MVLRKHELEVKLKDDLELVRSGVLREENPLDTSDDFNELLQACRRGDLRRTQELISEGVNLNGKDKFDYTPLIIASLCGHYELVRLLLESGALAERDTFQGERCIYNALNDRIRNLLLQYDYSKSTDPLQPWAAHLTSLLSRETPATSDISLVEGRESFSLHKFVLSSRSPYFKRKLAENPETPTMKLQTSIPSESYALVLRYLYLGEIPRDIVNPGYTMRTEEEVLKGVDKLAKDLQIDKLWEAILSQTDRRLARQRHQDEVNRAQKQVEGFFKEKVLGHKMLIDTKKVQDVKWPYGNAMFADCLLRADEADPDIETSQNSNGRDATAAIGIPIGPGAGKPQVNGTGKTRKSALYPVHKAMLIRSPYFETMFSSQFMEAQTSEHLHIIQVDCLPEVLELVLTFLYTENVHIPLEYALDLLYASDMLFLDKLKAKAAVAISTLGSGNNNILVDRTHGQQQQDPDKQTREDGSAVPGVVEVEPINVYDVLHAAWDLRVQRLEEFAARYLAYRLEDYIDEEDFAQLINESALRIKNREETDTIELLDDIRYYLSERFRLRFEDAGLDEMLDETGELAPEAAEAIAAAAEASNGVANVPAKENGSAVDPALAPVVHGQASSQATVDGAAQVGPQQLLPGTTVRTLDGEVAADEFESDALNYQLLLQKIDIMLDKLKLDA
ncbi:BTB/POZ domain-containing protein [Microdochium bolleyi]|uniref:BTB/POZ domain-containing protein n=1 Tax=Microdochium bolleyi TaxID=196109 RepID=A0A136JA08_9PEZI|nr:BTB/POZ domain-containing protein [Microdochium bolleyi]